MKKNVLNSLMFVIFTFLCNGFLIYTENKTSKKKEVLSYVLKSKERELKRTIKKYPDLVNHLKLKKNGGSLLHLACSMNNLNIVKLLLNCDANIDSLDFNGRSVLHWASNSNRVEIVDFLIKKGINVNAEDKKGYTPLFAGIFSGNLEVVKKLVINKAKINIKAKDNGSTPLLLAIKLNNDDMVKLLIKNGADPNLSDKENVLPLEQSLYNKNSQIAILLIKNGANIFSKNIYEKNTPLHLAVYQGLTNVVSLLLKKGAWINEKNYNGDTPLDIAYTYGKKKIADLIIPLGGIRTEVKGAKIKKISKDVKLITFPYSLKTNILLIEEKEEVILVDTGFRRTANLLKNYYNKKLEFIINTHSHGDHNEGNVIQEKETRIIGLKSLEKHIKNKTLIKEKKRGEFNTIYLLKFGKKVIKLILYPGLHSDTDMMIYLSDQKIVHMGDLLLTESFPAVEKNFEYIRFLNKVLTYFPKETHFIGGHGKILTKIQLISYFKMVVNTVNVVSNNFKNRLSVNDMIKNDILKKWSVYGDYFTFIGKDGWIKTIVNNMNKKK